MPVATRPLVARAGDVADGAIAGMHGNHPWTAYFDGRAKVTVRFGAIGSDRVMWSCTYEIGPDKWLKSVPEVVARAQHDFDQVVLS